jgi:hypothetical protein
MDGYYQAIISLAVSPSNWKFEWTFLNHGGIFLHIGPFSAGLKFKRPTPTTQE